MSEREPMTEYISKQDLMILLNNEPLALMQTDYYKGMLAQWEKDVKIVESLKTYTFGELKRDPVKRHEARKRYYKKGKPAVNHKVRWTLEDEIKVIIRDKSDEQLAEELGRSIQAIQNKRLNLLRNEEFVNSINNALTEL